MSIDDARKAIDLITENEDADFVGPIAHELISDAQTMLGITFPPSFILFLEELGCGDVGGLEFYGIVSDDLTVSGEPNAIWLTLEERKSGLPHSHVIVSSTGDGSYFSIDTSERDKKGESPVMIVGPTGNLTRQSDSFGAFLLNEIRLQTHNQ
ncbi:MAG: SMI1/KNR4 family protein [Pseudomonadota bacterium]